MSLGTLSRVKRIVKLTGFVNASSPDFEDHPRVINGASNLFAKVFGANIGQHARSAVGVASLPLNGLHKFFHLLDDDSRFLSVVPVELEAIFEIDPNNIASLA